MNFAVPLVALLLLGACATAPPESHWPPGFHPPSNVADLETVDQVAPDYVRLQLEIGERDEGYVDA